MIYIPNYPPPTPPRRYVARVQATASGDTPVKAQSTINVIAYDQVQAERAALGFARINYPRALGWRIELEVREVIL